MGLHVRAFLLCHPAGSIGTKASIAVAVLRSRVRVSEAMRASQPSDTWVLPTPSGPVRHTQMPHARFRLSTTDSMAGSGGSHCRDHP